MATQRQLQYRAQQSLRGNTPPSSDVWRWQGFTAPGVGRITNASGVEIIAPVQGNASTAIGAQVLYIPGQPTGVIRLKEVVVPGVPPVIRVEPVPVITLYTISNESEGQEFIEFYVWFKGTSRLIHRQENAIDADGFIELTSATTWIATISWTRTTGITIPRWFDAGYVTDTTEFVPAIYPNVPVQDSYLNKGKVAIHANANSPTYAYLFSTTTVDAGECAVGTAGSPGDLTMATSFTSGADLSGSFEAIAFYLRGIAQGILLLESGSQFAYFFVSGDGDSFGGVETFSASYIGGTATSFSDGQMISAQILQREIVVNPALPQNGIDENSLTISDISGEIITINPANNFGSIKPGAGQQVIPRIRNSVRKIDDSAIVYGVAPNAATVVYQRADGTETALTRTANFSGGLFAALEDTKYYAVNGSVFGELGFVNIYDYDLDAGTYTQTGVVEYQAPNVETELGNLVLVHDHSVWPRKLKNILPF